MQKLICIGDCDDISPRMTNTKKCDTHVEHMDVLANYEGVTSYHFDSHGKDKNPFTTIPVTEPANWEQWWCDDRSKEISCTDETEALLGLAKQIKLLNPIIDILTIVLISAITGLRNTSLTNKVFAASLPWAIHLFASKMMRFTLEKGHSYDQKVDWIATN